MPSLHPVALCKCLADATRLRCVALLLRGELCVCDLTRALDLPQPTVSRHLAQLRAGRVVADRRQGLWVYYRLHEQLPAWAMAVLNAAVEALAEDPVHAQDLARLRQAGGAVCGEELSSPSTLLKEPTR